MVDQSLHLDDDEISNILKSSVPALGIQFDRLLRTNLEARNSSALFSALVTEGTLVEGTTSKISNHIVGITTIENIAIHLKAGEIFSVQASELDGYKKP